MKEDHGHQSCANDEVSRVESGFSRQKNASARKLHMEARRRFHNESTHWWRWGTLNYQDEAPCFRVVGIVPTVWTVLWVTMYMSRMQVCARKWSVLSTCGAQFQSGCRMSKHGGKMKSAHAVLVQHPTRASGSRVAASCGGDPDLIFAPALRTAFQAMATDRSVQGALREQTRRILQRAHERL